MSDKEPTTRTIRVKMQEYKDCIELFNEEKEKDTPMAALATSNEGVWFTHLLSLGRKVYMSNRKKGK